MPTCACQSAAKLFQAVSGDCKRFQAISGGLRVKVKGSRMVRAREPQLVGHILADLRLQFRGEAVLHEKSVKLKPSGDEVYYTAYSLLVILKNSCSNLDFQKGINSIISSYKTSESRPQADLYVRPCLFELITMISRRSFPFKS